MKEEGKEEAGEENTWNNGKRNVGMETKNDKKFSPTGKEKMEEGRAKSCGMN